MYKIVNGIEEVKWYNPPELAPSLSANSPASAIRGNRQLLWREQLFKYSRKPWNTRQRTA